MSPAVSTLLARWHQWRSHYSHERGFARVRYAAALAEGGDDYADLEAMEMRSMEDSIAMLPVLQQLALQHVARTECLGVEVIKLNRLPANPQDRDLLCAQAVAALQRLLIAQGVL